MIKLTSVASEGLTMNDYMKSCISLKLQFDMKVYFLSYMN